MPILDEFDLIRTRVGRFIVGAGVLDDIIEAFMVAFVSIWIGESVAARVGTAVKQGLLSLYCFTSSICVGVHFCLLSMCSSAGEMVATSSPQSRTFVHVGPVWIRRLCRAQ